MMGKPIGVYPVAQAIMEDQYSFDPETGETTVSRVLAPCAGLPFAAFDKEGVTWRVTAAEADAIRTRVGK